MVKEDFQLNMVVVLTSLALHEKSGERWAKKNIKRNGTEHVAFLLQK